MFKLNPQDTVDIIAPGYGSSAEELEKAKDFIRSLDLLPRVPEDIFGEDSFSANSDSKRFEHLKKALYAKDSSAIWCLRGGYGTSRLAQKINALWGSPPEKLLIGFSDITVLHLILNQKWKLPTLHAPVLSQIVNNKISAECIDELKDVIFGTQADIIFDCLEPLNIYANGNGIIDAAITGGNLSLIQASIGTCWELQTKNRVVLLEEIGEAAYRVDRMLNHLIQSGIFKKAKAILLGDFIDGATQDKMEATLRRFAETVDKPVLRINGVGHGKINRPVAFGMPSELEFGQDNTLIIHVNSDDE